MRTVIVNTDCVPVSTEEFVVIASRVSRLPIEINGARCRVLKCIVPDDDVRVYGPAYTLAADVGAFRILKSNMLDGDVRYTGIDHDLVGGLRLMTAVSVQYSRAVPGQSDIACTD